MGDIYSAYTDPISKAYRDYLGRDPDPEGLSYWEGIAGSNGLEAALAGLKGSDEYKNRINGEEGGIEWPEGLYPKSDSASSAGLPEWGNEWVKKWLAEYSPQITSGLSGALTGMENPIALNEAEKANLDYYANENLRPVISNLGAKGVLNSSTSQNAIAKVLAELGSTSYDKAMANQQNKISNYQKSMALLESILGASRQSNTVSSTTNEWAPYADMMSYLAAMQKL